MADLRIVDAPEIPTENITGEEKLPTGGSGNYSISLDSVADYTKTKKDLADNTYVDGKVNGVRQELDDHIEDLLNPHQVTKGQIGLGNVDNTADADKPVSNSTQAAIISAVAPKADKTYVDSQDLAIQVQINQKVEASYVDNALSNLSTQASKFYPTLAEANADIANISVNQVVNIGEVANGGLWYKATAEATTLTKSTYDPLTQAKAFTKESTDVFDVSAYINNYNLTFAGAIAAVPTELRKQNLTVRYNNADERTFINSNLANWTNQRFWIRPTNTMAEGKVNHVDERMIYKGFILGVRSTITYGDDNYCMIIPIHRTHVDGVENKLTISAHPYALSTTIWMFLDGNGLSLGVLTGIAGLTNYTIPPTAQYVAFNIQSRNTSNVLITPENLDIAKKYLRYFPDNTAPTVSKPGAVDGIKSINYGIPAAIYEDRTRAGTEFVSPFFKNGLGSVGGLHIAQIVKHVEIQKGQQDIVVTSTGLPRRFIITRISKSADGKFISALISGENERGELQTHLPGAAPVDDYGFANIEWVRMLNDVLRVKLLVDANKIPNGAFIDFGDNGEIHPTVVLNADKVKYVNKGVQLTQFTDVGVARTSSNMALPDAEAVTLTKRMTNGFLFNKVTGDASKDHQQTTLIAEKLARFHGKANIHADVNSNYPNNPPVTMLRETGGAPYNVGTSSGYGVLGKTMDSQWIHPDMCYAPDGVGGYKYWMINSNFPNGSDRQEDANLFVSNDGVNWTRVRGFNESNDGGVGFKTPEIHWASNYADGFMSIPINGNSFEFALTSTTETKTITGYLDHDPAISYHNGYVNVYILYNLGFVNHSYNHKYVVCYRTNNGIDWEIVREDGSTMPYNQENAQLIFTKTNGVRNHICFKYRASGVGGLDLSPQVVKVSDNEWYYYARTGTSNMNLVRYAGTSPYTFDFNSPQPVSKNNATGGSLWHFGIRYYDGIFYCITHGFMFTSTDGINFTTTAYPFFWRGMSSDIYKPTFVVGHDGKVKMAYGIQSLLAVPHSYKPQNPINSIDLNRVQNSVKITSTLICEYLSLADIMNRSNSAIEDAYVDIVVMSISQRTKSTQVRLLPCLRSYAELLNTLDISFDDEVYVVAHMNTRNGGSVEFSGVAVTLPNAASI